MSPVAKMERMRLNQASMTREITSNFGSHWESCGKPAHEHKLHGMQRVHTTHHGHHQFLGFHTEDTDHARMMRPATRIISTPTLSGVA